MNPTVTLSAILLASLYSHVLATDCPSASTFVAAPTDVVRSEGETATFQCRYNFSSNVNENPTPRWEFQWLSNTTRTVVDSRLIGQLDGIISVADTLVNNIYVFDLTVSVSSEVAGEYICSFRKTNCPAVQMSGNLKVRGMPTISIHNDSFAVDTLQPFFITGRIAGFPAPEVQIFREINGVSEPITPENNPRFSSNFDDSTSTLTITLQNVMRADGGMYKIVATNDNGDDQSIFTLLPNGPDVPVLSFSGTNLVEGKAVASLGSELTITCRVQEHGFVMDNTTILWRNSQGNEVTADSGRPVTVGEIENNGRVLTISSLSTDLLGNYSCTATNVRGTDTDTVMVFGPPLPPPGIPEVSRVGSEVIVRWMRPSSSDVIITGYKVNLYISGQQTPTMIQRVDVSQEHTSASYTFRNLDAGTYEVTVTSTAGMVAGSESRRASFIVPEDNFPLLPVVIGAAVGGLVIVVIIIIVIFIAVYFSCISRKANTANSHQQRWGSEEDKMNHPPAPAVVQNTYTALALQDNSELPPSPLSPMTSSIGIDPKWEFPRENIQLSDVLAEGQFTVLYKGIARNLRDNKPCEIAVKSVKEDATEDDVKALIYEMDLLSSIEEHPNIVSLVRVCSVGKPLFMVMEYMCHGDLLGFLRACRGHHGMYTVSPGSGYQPPPKHLFTSRDILNMATKIASGMHYLADRKIVHRALCTRNVLVGSGMDVKIYNVGSFDASLDGVAKWMAPETLFDGTNTTYSDVWSFGVTLWELVTVGGTPYGEILPEDLYAQLQSGMRMPCPTHCAQEVYDIMSACWQKNPIERPHFSIIHDSLDELVMSKLNYVDVRSSDIDAYSQFDGDIANLSTAL